MEKQRAHSLQVAALALGLIGAILLFFAGACYAILGAALNLVAVEAGIGGLGIYTFVFYVCGFGGGVLAIVGAAMSLKNGKIAGVMMAIALVMGLIASIVLVTGVKNLFSTVTGVDQSTLDSIKLGFLDFVTPLLLAGAAVMAFIGEVKRQKQAKAETM